MAIRPKAFVAGCVAWVFVFAVIQIRGERDGHATRSGDEAPSLNAPAEDAPDPADSAEVELPSSDGADPGRRASTPLPELASGPTLRVVDPGGASVRGATLHRGAARTPLPAAVPGTFRLSWPAGEPGDWFDLAAEGFVRERFFQEPFEGEVVRRLAPEARLVGRLLPPGHEPDLDLSAVDVYCWEQPLMSPGLATSQRLVPSQVAHLHRPRKVEADGRFVIPGLHPSRTYVLYALHPRAVSWSVQMNLAPGPEELPVRLVSIRGCSLAWFDSGGQAWTPPSDPAETQSVVLHAPAGCRPLSSYATRLLADGRPRNQRLIAYRVPDSADVPESSTLELRFPGCAPQAVDVGLGPLSPESLSDPLPIIVSECSGMGSLEVTFAPWPVPDGARLEDPGVLRFLPSSGRGQVDYLLRGRDQVIRLPEGVHVAEFHGELGFFSGRPGRELPHTIEVRGGEVSQVTIDTSDLGTLIVDVRRPARGAYEGDFLCDLEKRVGAEWVLSRSNLVFRGRLAEHRLAIPLLSAGTYRLRLPPGFACESPPPEEPQDPEMGVLVVLEVRPGQVQTVVVSALF